MTELLQQLINGISLGAIYALIAVGYTMVYGVLRFINFAHGDVFMVGATVGLVAGKYYLAWAGEPSTAIFIAVLLTAMLACGVLGYLIELLAYRPLRGKPRITVLITAIGVSLLLEYGFQNQHVYGPDPRAFPALLPWTRTPIELGELIIRPIDILVVGLTVALTVGLTMMIKFTRVGMAIRAVSFRADTASLMGINANRVISLTFVLGSVLAAAGGIFWASKYPNVHPLMGLMPGIKAFVAAVLGGIGSIYGAVLGGLMLGLVEVLVVGYLDGSQYRDAVAFIILIAMLLLRPSGLLGQKLHEKV
jgi:branched-chain amino acid transport system permease protein